MTLNGLPTVLRHETVWMDAHRYQDAERQYHEYCAQHLATVNASSVKSQNKAPQTNLEKGDMLANNSEILQRIQKLSDENKEMRKTMSEMATKIRHLEDILSDITISKSDKDLKQTVKFVDTVKQNGPTEKPEDDDDIDLFGSDEETEEEARIKEERLKAYENKKSKKPALIAKSSVVLDVKPWDDETDMNALENAVRAISSDGLKWGAGKLVPLAYGIKKLQIIAIVEDDKVSIDWLQEAIQENEDLVQSVDIAAFNKL